MTTLIRQISNLLRPIFAFPALAIMLALAGCGGGGTGGTGQTAQPPAPVTISVLPASVTIQSGTPTTFTISGGTGPYQVFSSNLTVIPVNGVSSANGVFTIAANNVTADTPVTLTFQDAAGHTTTAAVLVKGVALTVVPPVVTINSATPTTFTVTGGTAPYRVFSSNLTVIPVNGVTSQNGVFTITANNVTTDTTVTLTFQDAGGSSTTAAVTIKAPLPLTVLPPSATIYSNNPAIITVTGGVPPYTMVSSNPAVIPSATAPSSSGNFLLTAANVASATVVTLTFRDSLGQTATATITVNPSPVAPQLKNLTVTPTPAAPGTGCAPAVCSGGDASVSVTLLNELGGTMAGRKVRFDAPQGSDYTIQTGNVAQPSVSSLTVTTDQNGVATVRILIKTTAPTQAALITATDVASGNFVTSPFTIAQFTDGTSILSVMPTTWNVTGPDTTTCSSGTAVTYYIFGGTPPYRVVSSKPDSVTLVGVPVTTNGGGFTAITSNATGCTVPLTFLITDATGRTVSATLNNSLGTAAPPPTNLEASPRDITIIPICDATGTATGGSGQSIITGGTGKNVVASDDPTHLLASGGATSPSVLNMTLQNHAVPGSVIHVTVDDGVTGPVTVTVTVGACPVINITPLTISASSAAMVCGEQRNFGISGGSGTYVFAPLPTGFTNSTIDGTILKVVKGSGADNTSATLTIGDTGGQTTNLVITGSGVPPTCP